MRNEIEDLINERLEALDEIDVVDSNNVNTVISSKVNEQNNKVEFSRKKQELIKIIDKFKGTKKRFYTIQVPAVSDKNGKLGPVKRESGESPEQYPLL